ncbi:MAG TPA: hypothetical protein VLF79_01965 [Candidatus Saccharimonadales bacterium]|nr:hypothetical protein [Candidatus Saccharimonadales bacterium]
MINLLPPEVKQSYRYARRNIQLRSWLIMFALTFIGLGIMTTYGFVILHQSIAKNNTQVAATEALFKKEDFDGTQKQIKDISNSFKLVVNVLSKEVLFSEILKQIGVIMPSNAYLTGLTINQVQGGLTITANTTDYKSATQVQINLSDPKNQVFSKADIENIVCQTGAASVDPSHPCTVTVRALFKTNNPYLFINSKAAKP